MRSAQGWGCRVAAHRCGPSRRGRATAADWTPPPRGSWAVITPRWPRSSSVFQCSGFLALTVLTLDAASARDFYSGAQGFSEEVARRPVVGRIPVHCLVLDLL